MSRYVVRFNGERKELDPEMVLGWVQGIADTHGKGDLLQVIDAHGPEETRRMQALQIGAGQGWFDYLYMER